MSTQNQNQNGYMLLFRGTDLRKGLSPEELQKVTDNWMAWLRRLTEEGKARGALRLDFSDGQRAVVRTVAIVTSQQRRGLGRSMMKLVEEYAMARGVELLEVNSAPDAVEFYRRLGWQMVDPRRESPLLRKRVGPRDG